jgi:biotin transport system substrate-specific component
MTVAVQDKVLSEAFGPETGQGVWVKRAVLVALGIAAMAILAKIRVPLWPSPVPITMQTFGVLLIGTAYGARLGLVTMFGYLLLGALGFDVFTSSSAEKNGLVYMMGGTGGYLFGYLLATIALGRLARLGWDRNVGLSMLAMLLASVLIYVPGLLWLHQFANGWGQTFAWGLTPFLIGDAMKLILAAVLVPAIWKLVGSART